MVLTVLERPYTYKDREEFSGCVSLFVKFKVLNIMDCLTVLLTLVYLRVII